MVCAFFELGKDCLEGFLAKGVDLRRQTPLRNNFYCLTSELPRYGRLTELPFLLKEQRAMTAPLKEQRLLCGWTYSLVTSCHTLYLRG